MRGLTVLAIVTSCLRLCGSPLPHRTSCQAFSFRAASPESSAARAAVMADGMSGARPASLMRSAALTTTRSIADSAQHCRRAPASVMRAERSASPGARSSSVAGVRPSSSASRRHSCSPVSVDLDDARAAGRRDVLVALDALHDHRATRVELREHRRELLEVRHVGDADEAVRGVAGAVESSPPCAAACGGPAPRAAASARGGPGRGAPAAGSRARTPRCRGRRRRARRRCRRRARRSLRRSAAPSWGPCRARRA